MDLARLTLLVHRHSLLLSIVLAVFACAPCEVFPAPASSALAVNSGSRWAGHDLWSGVVFKGTKIGFTHVRISKLVDTPGHLRIESEASLLLHFMGFEKSVRLRATDIVDARLNLIRFDAAYHLDGNDLALHGQVADTAIELETVNSGRRSRRSIPLSGPVIPTSAVLFVPVLRGLEIGAAYRFLSFNSETLTVDEVEQQVIALETGDLFAGEAFKVVSRVQGQVSTSWLDAQGRPLAEQALDGALISSLEEESEAKRYLVLAALNKQEVMLEFSTVRIDRPIENPRQVTQLELILRGAPSAPPSTKGQRCAAVKSGWNCRLTTGVGTPDGGGDPRYLRSSLSVPHDDPKIHLLAQQIAAGEQDATANIERILDWLRKHIRQHPADAFSALDVLESRRAECQGHAYLFTALARAMAIPTRVVNGLVYTEARQAFLYHSWTESYVDGAWRAVDPTFSQTPADATHIRIAEGEEAADLVALTDWIGRLSIDLIGYSHARPDLAD